MGEEWCRRKTAIPPGNATVWKNFREMRISNHLAPRAAVRGPGWVVFDGHGVGEGVGGNNNGGGWIKVLLPPRYLSLALGADGGVVELC